jgi:hypothetical protein
LPGGGLGGKVDQLKHHWLLKFAKKILSLFSAKEVKTPLSFFVRLLGAIVTLATLGVFLLPPQERPELLIGAGALLFSVAMIVGVITWSRPKNLVYGQTGYRASPRQPMLSSSRVVRSKGKSAA